MSDAVSQDIALETADIVLVKSDLRDVITAIDLSRATFNRIRVNYAWACLYNLLGACRTHAIIHKYTQTQDIHARVRLHHPSTHCRDS